MDNYSPVLLCVDDDPAGLNLRKIVLERAGYTVLTATSGEEAMSLMAVHAPDLLITDHLLPSMSGVQLAGEAKRLRPEVRVLILSGLIECPESANVDAFLCKVDGPGALIEKIGTVLKGRDS